MCFSLQVGHCVYGLYIIILMIIIIVVVYGYYYLSSLLAEDWHFEIVCPLMPLQKKNKLLLLILFHKSIDSEIFHPHFPIPLFALVSCFQCLKGTLILFILTYFSGQAAEATCLESITLEDHHRRLLYTTLVTSFLLTETRNKKS